MQMNPPCRKSLQYEKKQNTLSCQKAPIMQSLKWREYISSHDAFVWMPKKQLTQFIVMVMNLNYSYSLIRLART